MSKDRTFLTFAVVAAVSAAGGLPSFAHAADDLVRVSDAASPRVAYAVERSGGTLTVLLAVETLSPRQANGGVNVRLGAAADTAVILTGDKPERDTADGTDVDKGPQRIAWDGCDDQGVPLPPGEYRWRSSSSADDRGRRGG